MSKLFEQVKLGKNILKNRIAMAPMTRGRAELDGTPGEFTPKYYGQRSSVGLIITEGTQPSADGQGYIFSPGIYTDEHVAGWKKVTEEVHKNSGHIFIQLMHVGRMSHPDNSPNKHESVAPSAIAPEEKIFTPTGMQDIPTPKEMTVEDIQETISDFVKAAKKAIEAGADGVEIHGANGYLLHQFLGGNTNLRTDSYGGSVENRAKFLIEVATAVTNEIGADKVGFRISPMNGLGGVQEGEQFVELYSYLIQELNKLNLAYLHVMHVVPDEFLLNVVRNQWDSVLIVNRPGRKPQELANDINAGLADIVSVGSLVLANPDFVTRLKEGKDFNPINRDTLYIKNGEVGYTDYPTLD